MMQLSKRLGSESMESNFAKRELGRYHEYQNIEIVKIDGKKRVKRLKDGKIMHANKEAVSRDNTKRKIRRQRKSYFES